VAESAELVSMAWPRLLNCDGRPSIHKFNLTTAILFNFSTEGIVPRALSLSTCVLAMK
jgi:hypothetical protein